MRASGHALPVLTGSIVALAALTWPTHWRPAVRLVYNASDSVARGWYHIDASRRAQVGDLVLANLPSTVASWAAQRGYLPVGVPILKPVAAIAPQTVCIDATELSIDGQVVATAREVDGQGRTLTRWQQCRGLVDGELFFLSAHAHSFDSRYFGPLSVTTVIGVAQPIWTWRSP